MMKRISQSLLVLAFLLLSSTSFAGVVDIRFVDGYVQGEQYYVTAQIKAQDINFEIGSATLFFSYNTQALKNPSANSVNFNDATFCKNYTNSFNFLETNARGEGNYAILLDVANEGCPTVTNDWLDVAKFKFDVVDASASLDLKVAPKHTAFNTVDNGGEQHSLGAIIDLNEITSTGGNAGISANSLTIRPNFTKDVIAIQYTAQRASSLNITVYDMVGRVVNTLNENVTAGEYNKQLDLSNYTNGYYLIEVDNGTEKVSEKVLLAK